MKKEQIIALLYVISSAKILKEFEKKLMIYMIEKTNGLQKNVRVFFTPSEQFPEAFYYTNIAHACHFLGSTSSPISFNAVLSACGTNLNFSSGGENGPVKNWQVFLSSNPMDRKAKLLKPSRGTIEKIDLNKYRQDYEMLLEQKFSS